jgi:hypothetical protein
VSLKEPLDLPARHAHAFRNFDRRERVFNIFLHEHERIMQAWVTFSSSRYERNALSLISRALSTNEKHVADALW